MKQSEINQIVWSACDTFRGKIDPAQYKDYILTMLFVKFVSDLWEEKTQQLSERYKGDETRLERALRNERFYVPEKARFSYLYQHRLADNIGELINIGLEELEESNRLKLDGVFRAIDFNSETNLGRVKERNRTLANLLEDFNKLDLKPSHLESQDVIGDSYEYLLERFASDAGKKAGEFYTPAQVSKLLARLMAPKPGNRIVDIACGSGSLLLKVAREAESKNIALYGQEMNGTTWALARMNMFLHEADNARIEWGDTLNNPLLVENDELVRFDIAVANPPFSLDKWGAESAASDRYNRFWRGVPPKSKGDYAFITHMIETVYPDTGRVGVIVPHGVLFRGSSEGQIRRQLIEENLLEAVIGLPSNLFFGTGIPAAIIIFNRAKGENHDVLFVDASREFEAGKNQNRLRDQDIERIVSTYRVFQDGAATYEGEAGYVIEERYAYRATPEDIKANGYNLNIPRYVDTFVEEEPIDLVATQAQIGRLKAELAEAEERMGAYLKQLGL